MKIIAALLVLSLSSCVTTKYHEPIEWSSLESGCYARGLSDVLFLPEQSGTMISLTDIRIGRLPDTDKGPGLLAHFRRHLDGFAQSKGQPDLFLAIGDWKRSCAVVVKLDACPAADKIYKDLASQSIPIGYAFDDPEGFTVIHGTTYFLSVNDGQGNQTNWEYYGLDHPLKEKVSIALDELESCAAPAAAAFNRGGTLTTQSR